MLHNNSRQSVNSLGAIDDFFAIEMCVDSHCQLQQETWCFHSVGAKAFLFMYLANLKKNVNFIKISKY